MKYAKILGLLLSYKCLGETPGRPLKKQQMEAVGVRLEFKSGHGNHMENQKLLFKGTQQNSESPKYILFKLPTGRKKIIRNKKIQGNLTNI